jgi:hypothetical protein
MSGPSSRVFWFCLGLGFVLGACGSSSNDRPDAPAGGDAAGGDANGDAAHDAGNDGSSTTFDWPTCGAGTFDGNLLYYGTLVAVASDGTVFHDEFDGGEDYIARFRPNQPPEHTWAHVGTAATGAIALTVDPHGTPYALISDRTTTQLVRIDNGSAVPIGAAVAATSGPTALAVSPDGIVVEATFTGLYRVDATTGARTSISAPVQFDELYFVDTRTARGVTYDHGLVEVRFDANLTTSTYSTIFPFTTIALQVTGVDMTGRPYAIIHESSKDELVRFDPTFTTRETLYSYPTVPIALGRFAFGRGALRCDVLIAGFSIAHVTAGNSPAVP